MRAAIIFLLFGAVLTLSAGEKKTPVGKGQNEDVDLTATAYPDKEGVKQILGDDLGGYYVVVSVKLTPRNGKLKVERDDFTLRTDRDGEKSTPFSSSQIAGRGALVVSQTGGGGGGFMGDGNGPIIGGYPGTMGRPRRMGGDGGGVGNAGDPGGAEAKAHTGSGEKENPLRQALEEKILPEKETEEPVSGLLYFPLEPKQKLKDLELIYKTASGKINVRFR